MKYLFLMIAAGLFLCQSAAAQNKPSAHPGKKGIFIWCGKTLPKNFSYRISRKAPAQQNWQQVAILHFPADETAWQGRIMKQAISMPEMQFPDSAISARLWQKLKISSTSDSLYMWAAEPLMLGAVGTGWWDLNAKKGQQYQYKVEKLQGNKVNTSVTTKRVSYPGTAPDFQMRPDTLEGNGPSVDIRYRLVRYAGMAGAKVYRAYYLRDSSFVQIHPFISFYDRKGQKYMDITDMSVVNSAQYSYYVVPFDMYGNEGHPSVTVNIYNKRLNTIKPIVTDFNGVSRGKKNVIRLSWKINNPGDVVSVDIYKSMSYGGYYTHIASVSPHDTVFLDHNVKPVTTYFYTLVLREAYGRTLPSARAAVIFRANKKNPFPPLNLEAERDGNVVKLSWQRTAPDTRGYYLYRSGSFTGPMHPVGQIILSKDSVVTYTDSLAHLPYSPTWVYAVASENTSYAISPLTSRVSVSGVPLHLPVPSAVRAMVIDNKVQLLWNDLFSDHPEVTGYRIERHEDANPEQGKPVYFDIETPGISSYLDTTVSAGHHYSYTVQSVGLNSSNISSPSLPAGAYLPPDILPAPNNIMVLNSGKGVLIRWDLPMGSQWNEIKIYRAEPGQSPELLKVLPPDATDYTDKRTKKGHNYFYWIAIVNKKGKEGKIKEPVGIKTLK